MQIEYYIIVYTNIANTTTYIYWIFYIPIYNYAHKPLMQSNFFTYNYIIYHMIQLYSNRLVNI